MDEEGESECGPDPEGGGSEGFTLDRGPGEAGVGELDATRSRTRSDVEADPMGDGEWIRAWAYRYRSGGGEQGRRQILCFAQDGEEVMPMRDMRRPVWPCSARWEKKRRLTRWGCGCRQCIGRGFRCFAGGGRLRGAEGGWLARDRGGRLWKRVGFGLKGGSAVPRRPGSSRGRWTDRLRRVGPSGREACSFTKASDALFQDAGEAVPRQPAWNAATMRRRVSATRMGTQSAVRMARVTPGQGGDERPSAS